MTAEKGTGRDTGTVVSGVALLQKKKRARTGSMTGGGGRTRRWPGRSTCVIGSVGGGERGRWVASMVKDKAVSGLSFGYRVRRSARRDGVRELMDLDLVEVSVVANPMQPLARVHAVES